MAMNPEAAEAIRIADKHLAGESVERRKSLALDIQEAIVNLAADIAENAISQAFKTARRSGVCLDGIACIIREETRCGYAPADRAAAVILKDLGIGEGILKSPGQASSK